jgi:hypothetical protein
MPTNPADERPRMTVSNLADVELCAADYAAHSAA